MTNPLRQRPATSAGQGYVMVDGHQVPTDIHAYREWLEQHDHRHGSWRVVSRENGRSVEFMTERGSAEWLADRGFAPKIGKAA